MRSKRLQIENGLRMNLGSNLLTRLEDSECDEDYEREEGLAVRSNLKPR
jgi:hypothetical protein